MKELFSILFGFAAVVAIVILFVGTPMYFMEKYQCGGYAEALNLEHKYSLATKCVIKTPQGWIQSKNYIINKEEK